MSFSVIAPRAVLSDGFATGAFVLGADKGMKVLDDEGLEGIAIDLNGKYYISKGLTDKVEWVSDKYTPAR